MTHLLTLVVDILQKLAEFILKVSDIVEDSIPYNDDWGKYLH